MRSYKELTTRYLGANKKRTITTIIGIILSIALITCVGTFFLSLQNSYIEDEKRNSGAFHVGFNKGNEEILNRLKGNPKVTKVGTYQEERHTNIKGNEVSFVKLNKEGMQLLMNSLKEGQLPTGKNEVVLEPWILSKINKNAKVGDKIKIDLDGKEEEFLVKGIIANRDGTQQNKKTVIGIYSEDIDINKAMIVVEVSNKGNMKNTINELSTYTDKNNFFRNEHLLAFMGASGNYNFNSVFYSMAAIIIGIVVVATVAIIYNAFHISVVQRIRDFGLLRAVGTTPSQIRIIVLREATIIALICIPLGLLLGIGAIYIVAFVFNNLLTQGFMGNLKVIVNFNILIISSLVSMAAIYASAIFPAKFAGRISPLVAISSRTSITKENIKKRRGILVKKIFGISGAMAYKNIKRNKKRFRVTVFSMVISITLFITFNDFLGRVLNLNGIDNESKKINFSVDVNNLGSKEKHDLYTKIYERMKSEECINKIYKDYNLIETSALINKEKIDRGFSKLKPEIFKSSKIDENDKIKVNASVNVYDDNKLEVTKTYLKQGSIKTEELNKENGVIVLMDNYVNVNGVKCKGGITNLKVGDEICIANNADNTSYKKSDVKKVKVLAILNKEAFDFIGSDESLKLITTKEVASNLFKDKLGENIFDISKLNIKLKDTKSQRVISDILDEFISSNSNINYANLTDSNEMGRSSIIQGLILVYGFIIVITLIGSVNIINTVSTNLILRKNEFATLKAIGMTIKSIRRMVSMEGILYGVISCIYGSIIGSLLANSLCSQMNKVMGVAFTMPWKSIIIASAGSIFIAYISVLLPLRNIDKSNIIEAIRESE